MFQIHVSPVVFQNLVLLNSAVLLLVLVILFNQSYVSEKGYFFLEYIRGITDRDRKKLYKEFLFYRKLTPHLRQKFEQKLRFFLYKKRYFTFEGKKVSRKRKLLISAYASMISFGMQNFNFKSVKEIVIYSHRFYSEVKQKIVSWEITSEGKLLLCWKDFYKEMKNQEVESPIGLKLMVFAMKLETGNSVKEEIYRLRPSVIYRNMPVFTEHGESRDRDSFFMHCLVRYFSNPQILKNQYPDIFKKLEVALYPDH